MKAAVLYSAGEPLKIEELEIPKPQVGEVLVKLVATGVCHTDYAPYSGDMPVPPPIVLGHEGAGIVEEIGPGVTSVKPGDHVILFVLPSCGKCRQCVIGKPYLCEPVSAVLLGGTMMDGTTRLNKKDGTPINSFFCQSSFAEYAVVYESAAIKVADDIPLDKVCILSCGVSTGIGALINKAKVAVGSTVAIIGCGGVGQSAIVGASLCNASKIIAIDVADNKLEFAKEIGATHTINSAKVGAMERIQAIAPGGVDFAFECIGRPETVVLALDGVRFGGTAVIVGMVPWGTTVGIDAMFLLFDKTLTGCIGGSTRGRVDIPGWIDLYKAGKIPLDKMITRTYKLEQINEAFGAMEKGEVIRSVLPS